MVRLIRCFVVVVPVLSLGVTVRASEDPAAKPSLHPKCKIVTNRGEFTVELDAEKAPGTVLNFVQYAEDKFYDGTIFHRVVRNFVIQGGGLLPSMEEKTGQREPIRNESMNGLKNLKGTIAMARRTHPQSATSQFFINIDNNDKLDYKPVPGFEGYAVFGKVVDGNDTIDKIRETEVALHPRFQTKDGAVTPVEVILIETVKVLTPLDKEKAKTLAAELTKKFEEVERETKLATEKALPDRLKKFEEEAKAQFTTTETGLKYLDLKVGAGATPALADSIDVMYRGTLVDGTEFDSSQRNSDTANPYSRGAATFKMSRVIKGWQEGLANMKEGGKRIIVVPPLLGYGKEGIPGRIPGDAILFYEIELLTVKFGEE